MKRRSRKTAPPTQGRVVAERIAWIDRVVRALDIQPGPPVGLILECRQLRSALNTFRDGLVLGARLTEARKKPK